MEKTRKDRALEILGALINLWIFALVLLPWIKTSRGSETIFQYEVHVLKGAADYSLMSAVLFAAPVAGAIAALVKAICLFRGTGFTKSLVKITHFNCGCAVVYMAYFFSFSVPCTAWGYMWPFIIIVDFILNKYALEYKEMDRRSKALDKKHIEEKQERKERLAFGGRYSSGIYRILRGVARAYRGEYILLTLCGGVSSTFLFAALGIRRMFQTVHTGENLLIGGGLEQIIKDTMMTAIILNIILMAFAYGVYGSSRRRAMGGLKNLGARSDLLVVDQVMEYIVSSLISVAMGCGAGTVIVLSIKHWASEAASINGAPLSPVMYLITLGFYGVLTFFSLMVNYQISNWQTNSETVSIRKERLPRKWETGASLGAGVVFMTAGIVSYGGKLSSEDLKYMFYSILGAGFIMYGISGMLARYTRKGNQLLRTGRSAMTYHFMTTAMTMIILTGIQFAILGPYAIRQGDVLMAEKPERLFPYDQVMMGDEKDSDLVLQMEKTGADVLKVPGVRVTTAHGGPYTWADILANTNMGVLWPQGQHFMIPESEYYLLKDKVSGDSRNSRNYKANLSDGKLNLKGSDVHVVFQQDSSLEAHPFEWLMYHGQPNFRIGQPLDSYNWMDRQNVYPEHKIESSEYAVLTGVFNRGKQENLVVVSDRYFSSIRESQKEGPDVMYLVNTDKVKGHSDEMNRLTREFTRRHKADSRWDREIRPVYSKKAMIKDVTTERIMRTVVNTMTLIILMFASVLITVLRFTTQEEELKRKYTLLFYLGTDSRTKKRFVRNELRPYFLPAFATAAGTALVFQKISWSMRQFTPDQVRNSAVGTMAVWLVFLIVQLILREILKRKISKMDGNQA